MRTLAGFGSPSSGRFFLANEPRRGYDFRLNLDAMEMTDSVL